MTARLRRVVTRARRELKSRLRKETSAWHLDHDPEMHAGHCICEEVRDKPTHLIAAHRHSAVSDKSKGDCFAEASVLGSIGPSFLRPLESKLPRTVAYRHRSNVILVRKYAERRLHLLCGVLQQM